MALTSQQLWVAEKIDTRMQKLIRAGKDNMAIMAAMADHMPAFHQLLNTAQPGRHRPTGPEIPRLLPIREDP